MNSSENTLILYFIMLGIVITLGGLFVRKHSK